MVYGGPSAARSDVPHAGNDNCGAQRMRQTVCSVLTTNGKCMRSGTSRLSKRHICRGKHMQPLEKRKYDGVEMYIHKSGCQKHRLSGPGNVALPSWKTFLKTSARSVLLTA